MDGTQLAEGDTLVIDGSAGVVTTDDVPLEEPKVSDAFQTVLSWADELRQLGVRTNADTPEDAARAREFGAEGMGLCRTEHMFMAADRQPKMRRMIMAETEEERRAALDKLLPLQQEDFEGLFHEMRGLPVTVRLLDPPLHEFLPHVEDVERETERARFEQSDDLDQLERTLRRVHELEETNPMLGTRGVRLGVLHPEIYEMQARAIVRAAKAVAGRSGEAPRLEIMIPLVAYEKELELMRELVLRVVDEEGGEGLEVLIGTMIELPRACFVADRIARRGRLLLVRHQRPHADGARLLARRRRGQLPAPLHQEEDRRPQPVRDDRPAGGGLARAPRRLDRARGQARPQARGLRRARGGPGLDPLLPARRARLRELLAVPRADRPCGGCPGGTWLADPRGGVRGRVGGPERITRVMSRTAASAPTSFRSRVERIEAEHRSPLATPSYPAHRAREEADSEHRTPFQRDRDRIVHSKAFRRLKHKTQVLVAPEGDHYRTRLTHTLEACGIARNVARALGLNEDLTEAIGLGHDLGHPPFGHIGEEVLDACVRERWGRAFRHNEHSLRVVERIEDLNLTEQVRDGILRHTGPEPPATLEGRIVRVVDRIAYINHDIDDAVRAGILSFDSLPRAEIELLGSTGSARIETLVRDLLERSEPAGDIVQGEEVGGAMLRLREFMFASVYLGPDAQREKPRIERMLRALFAHLADNPPPALTADATEEQRVIDWLAGMTDRFAVRTFADLSVPQGF